MTGRLASAGAISGLKAWTAYWIIECFFLAPLSGLFTAPYECQQPHPWFAVLALVVYTLSGAAGGALIAVCAGSLLPRRASSPACMPVSMATTGR
jgi:hypothetical protein